MSAECGMWHVESRRRSDCASLKSQTSSLSVRGFTLLEVMVAGAILSLVLAALYGVFSRTLASKRLVEERLAQARSARAVLFRIGEDLQASFPLSTEEGSFHGGTGRAGALPTSSLSFVSAAHPLLAKGTEGDLYRIGYSLVPDPLVLDGFDHYQLVRSVQPEVYADQDAIGHVTALLPVRGLRLRFFDGQTWREEWGAEKTRGKLPRAVEITLYLDDADEETAIFSTVVDLPLVGSRRSGAS